MNKNLKLNKNRTSDSELFTVKTPSHIAEFDFFINVVFVFLS